jgi:hypothetical protein
LRLPTAVLQYCTKLAGIVARPGRCEWEKLVGFVHKHEPLINMMHEFVLMSRQVNRRPALRGEFAKRRIALLDSTLLQGTEESDHATGERGFEAQSCDQGRTGARGRRVDVLAGGGRISIGVADRGRAADAELCTNYRNHAR